MNIGNLSGNVTLATGNFTGGINMVAFGFCKVELGHCRAEDYPAIDLPRNKKWRGGN